jgi:hypothetical protein
MVVLGKSSSFLRNLEAAAGMNQPRHASVSPISLVSKRGNRMDKTRTGDPGRGSEELEWKSFRWVHTPALIWR